ncbi:MAG TPA: GWxTD domain-containing protein [Candidatus Cloacimonadota bacterium]|mgnify:CR=1 FL=1|nr:GWxTD domain-containing protein [Candidatus Cloacimonadota bacterium]
MLLIGLSALIAQDMVFETYHDGVDFWLLVPYNQLVFRADGSDSHYQVYVEVKGKGIKSRTLYNNQLVIPKRDWLNDSGIPVRFSAKLPAGTYTFSISIRNTLMGGKQTIKKQAKIGENPTGLGMAYVIAGKDGVEFIPSSLKRLPADLSFCKITQRFSSVVDSVSLLIGEEKRATLNPERNLEIDLIPYITELADKPLKLIFHEINIFYHLDPFLFSPWFSYGLRYSQKDQLAQIRYIATQAEWQVLRKVPSDKYSEAIEQYWTLHDPSPGTLRNEAREQFYQRVLIADERYSLHKKLKGWVSDRGRIYIKYGDPDEISSENLPLNAYPYIIWHYYSRNLEFIFADVGGFGQYQLRNKDEEY